MLALRSVIARVRSAVARGLRQWADLAEGEPPSIAAAAEEATGEGRRLIAVASPPVGASTASEEEPSPPPSARSGFAGAGGGPLLEEAAAGRATAAEEALTAPTGGLRKPAGAVGAPAPDAAGESGSPAPLGSEQGPSRPGPLGAGGWVYAFWRAPGACEDSVGVRAGGARAWRGVQARLPGRVYCYHAGTRLRRFEDLAGVEAGYREEARLHGSPPSPRLFYW